MSKISIFLCVQYDGLIVQLHNRSINQYKDADEITKESRRRLSNSLAKICYCLEDAGLLCASEVLVRIGFKLLMFALVLFCLEC
jgi:hypothetical protein